MRSSTTSISRRRYSRQDRSDEIEPQFLETDRLRFRSHRPADEDAFVAMHSDDEVRRYVGGRGWPADKARSRFRDQYLGKPSHTFGLWATELKETGAYIGMCGLARSDIDAHLGFYLARPYWGRRLATEAARAFVDLGFDKSECFPENGRIIDHYAIRSARYPESST
jgi:RimJ/RimL family protein N-acetyltransferase